MHRSFTLTLGWCVSLCDVMFMEMQEMAVDPPTELGNKLKEAKVLYERSMFGILKFSMIQQCLYLPFQHSILLSV